MPIRRDPNFPQIDIRDIPLGPPPPPPAWLPQPGVFIPSIYDVGVPGWERDSSTSVYRGVQDMLRLRREANQRAYDAWKRNQQEELARQAEQQAAETAQRQPAPDPGTPKDQGSEIGKVTTEKEMAGFWDTVIDTGLDWAAEKWVPTGTPFQPAGPATQIPSGGVVVPIPTGPVAAPPGVPTGPRGPIALNVGGPGTGKRAYARWDVKLQQWVEHHHRRRRRRLITDTDYDDLLRIGTLPNKDNVKIALSKAIRR